MPILCVALPGPLRQVFDYLPPANWDKHTVLEKGCRVSVPFGHQKRIGIIVDLRTSSELNVDKLKPIDAVLDAKSLFPPNIFALIHWASNYYHYPLGEVFDAALPVWLRKGKSFEALDTKPSKDKPREKDKPPTLNPAQTQAVKQILNSFGKFKTFLLDGVTGSGKTEVYLRIIEECLARKQQALVLVPEIGLTPQMLNRFQARFQCPIATMHSSLSEKKRFLAFKAASLGEAHIIIGTRSAVFTPLLNPGVFILDEEHDASFKQQTGFRYSARDVMIMRASLENCPVVLGSATPSLETLHNTHLSRYQNLSLPFRAGRAKPPNIQVIDIRHQKLEEGLSSQLIQKMQEHVNAKGQVLLFLNRRGFAPVFMCFDCGAVSTCKHCDARLILHFGSQQLRCHHCDATKPKPTECEHCKSRNLHPLGVGTERLEAALKCHFPDKNIIRIDKDSTRKKGSLETAVKQVTEGEADILLGTQMIAKGHHFPNVTMVAIVDIDSALFSVDFRSLERLGQLLMQVAGRAGREERLGEVLLQTCHPAHPVINILLNSGYKVFAEHLLIERQNAGLPPFSYQALIRAESKTLGPAVDFLKQLKNKLERKVLNCLGPIPAPMEKRLGKHRAQLLLQAANRSTLQNQVKALIAGLGKTRNNAIKWSIDIDPLDMY